MTLREIRARYPHLFHVNQTWFDAEPFMDREGPEWVGPPSGAPSIDPASAPFLPFAVALAVAYIAHPHDPIWRRYLWTADTDHLGQRVYMGVNQDGMEIHRHLHITERWGVPTWE